MTGIGSVKWLGQIEFSFDDVCVSGLFVGVSIFGELVDVYVLIESLVVVVVEEEVVVEGTGPGSQLPKGGRKAMGP
ncbi:hypothetical protein DFQ28_007344 [Apophysomyces sp. BC1034]|nr:hypothetical protein DFQ28_007344 [Apophysomyces sp. BC1034]